MSARPQILVFTDLDGTLLDHEDYSWEAARPALDALAAISAPVILTSSKTAAEITLLQNEMGLSHFPAIVENGAGSTTPNNKNPNTNEQYQALRAGLKKTPLELRKQFQGFADMTNREVSERTGLSEEEAKRAKTRQYSEPGLWSGSEAEAQEFIAKLKKLGIQAREGGRFLTLSFGKTKADPMREIIAHYQPKHSVALGDAPNDIEMLETADYGIIISNPHRAPLPLLQGETSGKIIRTKASGPKGWNAAIITLMSQLGIKEGIKTHG